MGKLRGEKRESAQKNKEKHLKGVSETCLVLRFKSGFVFYAEKEKVKFLLC